MKSGIFISFFLAAAIESFNISGRKIRMSRKKKYLTPGGCTEGF
ncbi:MAG TPA: hypothetical protein VN368_02770 [Candidatus Methylomirabilis sp.]|nr:hypothetical protein [Candidatus Methylomirabilis sp.]